MLSFAAKHPVLIAISVALLALSLYLTWRKHNMIRQGHLANGEVIALIPHRGSKGGTNYSLRVAYVDTDGTHAEFVTNFSSNPPMHDRGEKVKVICYAGNIQPEVFSFKDIFMFPWLLFCAGGTILFCCAGFVYGPVIMNHLYFSNAVSIDPLKAMGLLK